MNNEILIHLTLIQDVGPATILRLLLGIFLRKKVAQDASWEICRPTMNELVASYELLELDTLYDYHQADFLACGLSEQLAQRLYEGLKKRAVLERELALTQQHAVRLVTIFDQEYPKELLEIAVPPPVLYVAGGLLSHRKMIAVVGSREATSYAQRVIDLFAPALLAQGWSIVSGGARGVDTMAHKAALASGLTVAVIGSGLLAPYPEENKTLFKQLCEQGGSMISPFPLCSPPERWNFPARNRIIAGLSSATVVVQAATKSGALITAGYALEQGRMVFTVPGSIFEPLSRGCHQLLKQGALLAQSPDDLFENMGVMSEQVGVKQVIKSKQENSTQQSLVQRELVFQHEQIKPAADPVLELLKQELSVDELAALLNLDCVAVQQKLFDLQLVGSVEQDFTGLWRAL